MCKKKLTILSTAIMMAILAGVFFPIPGIAADPSPPVPTPPILNHIPPAWSRTLQCDTTACPRFELVMGGEAVLDHETGLVWQREVNNALWTWAGGINQCNYVNTGDRWGWHLPTVEQLLTLAARRPQGVTPKLPEGHPFMNVSIDTPYWTATTYTGAPWSAWELSFGPGPISTRLGGAYKDALRPIWCVRGGQVLNHDQ